MSETSSEQNYTLPSGQLLQHACKMGIVEDKPIMLDYWTDSLEKQVLIGVKKESEEKLLVKNAEEYTSPISKIYKVSDCYIICTENSILHSYFSEIFSMLYKYIKLICLPELHGYKKCVFLFRKVFFVMQTIQEYCSNS